VLSRDLLQAHPICGFHMWASLAVSGESATALQKFFGSFFQKRTAFT
jgi:hypothetical protein